MVETTVEPTVETKSAEVKNKTKAPSGGGVSGFFKRLWYYLKFVCIGLKWNFIELFTFHKKFDLKKVPRRPGDVAIITGGTRGIGKEVIRKLLILDMHVIIGCRNVESGEEMVEAFRKSGISTGSTEVISLDLMSLESVRDFGNFVLAKYSKIHVLINNAGIMAVPYNVTKDGFESQLQVNYLSHFLLTNILLPKLIKAGRPGKASRIVNVSSVAHYGGTINFDDINLQRMYSAEMAYMSSKLMQVVSTRNLDSRLTKEGLHLKVYAVHPGVVKTDLYEHICLARVFACIFRLFFKTPEQGADGVLYTAISTKFEGDGGLFFANCKKNSVNGLAKKSEIQNRLWDLSCQLTKWTDIPISDVLKQTMATRGTNQTRANELKILNEIVPKFTQTRKSETDSIKRALEPMKFIDDLEDIEELDIPDPPESSPPRSSSSSASSNTFSGKGPSRSSVSSTATVIAGSPIEEKNVQAHFNSSEPDAGTGVETENNQSPDLTTPKQKLPENIGFIPTEVTERVILSSVGQEDCKSDVTGGETSFMEAGPLLPLTEEQDVTPRSTSESYGRESISSSFTYASTLRNTFNKDTNVTSSSSDTDSVSYSSPNFVSYENSDSS